MPDISAAWQPSALLRSLLFTDFDGESADPDDVIAEALDGGYVERTDGLVEILQDESVDPIERFLACCALTSWADPIGYGAVVTAASAPENVVWKDASYDRIHSEDDTFGQLAQAVGSSADMIDERSSAADRIAAARTLFKIVDLVQFDQHVSAILRRDIIGSCLDDICAAIERGIARLAIRKQLTFDLGFQIALLVVAIAPFDEPMSTEAARRLAAADPGERALRELLSARAFAICRQA
ncbi:hypothetical protein [Streptomyces sp. NPDC054765]